MKQIFVLTVLSIFCLGTIQAAKTPEEVVDNILQLLHDSARGNYIGEEVSQLDHALQAAQGARDDGADDETIAAALLHDVGHLCADRSCNQMEQYGVDQHEEVGAQFVLNNGFSVKVAELIRGHVQAKRYLTYKNPGYYQQLSYASQQTLRMQGGPMTAQEAQQFENDPLFEKKLQMRRWDEHAKRTDWVVTPLEVYRTLLLKLLQK